MSNSTHYLPKGSAKQFNTSFFKLGVSFHLQEFIDYISENGLINDKGYVSLNITERKETGKFGDTHNVVIYDPNSTNAELNRRLSDMSEEQKEALLKQLDKKK